MMKSVRVLETRMNTSSSLTSKAVANHCDVFAVDVLKLFHLFKRFLHALYEELWVGAIHGRLFDSLILTEILLQVSTVNVGSKANCGSTHDRQVDGIMRVSEIKKKKE